MNAILSVAASSIREHSRRKLLAFFMLASLALMLVFIVIVLRAEDVGGTFGTPTQFVNTISSGVLGLFALIVAIAVSMGNVGQPFTNGEAMLIVSRPVARWQFVAGKLIASAAIILATCVVLGVEMQVVLLAAGDGISKILWLHWLVEGFNLIVIASITTLLSTLISLPVVVAVVTVIVNQIVGGVGTLYRLVVLDVFGGFIGKVIEVVWWITPKYLTSPLVEEQMRTIGASESSGPALTGPNPSDMLVPNSSGLVAWAIAYLAVVVVLSGVLAERKELR
ncbi:MAG TPA: hypothetical protein VND22_07800 [Actinomycetota bacterium]|nr:hypothetical protein [Actinomycetota bacterium]